MITGRRVPDPTSTVLPSSCTKVLTARHSSASSSCLPSSSRQSDTVQKGGHDKEGSPSPHHEPGMADELLPHHVLHLLPPEPRPSH